MKNKKILAYNGMYRSDFPSDSDISSIETAKSEEEFPKSTSLHTLSPYIGKMRPEIATWAINMVSNEGDLIYDPFCGSGTVLLEGWISKRRVVGSDLNPYAWLISQAKLNPYIDKSEADIDQLLSSYAAEAMAEVEAIDLRRVNAWVRSFYHPQTLKELMGWIQTLNKYRDPFAMACLMGIAHHQRPGFLSYPSSHLIPYLRTKKFPEAEFPEMYSYRPVLPRLRKKILRACSNIPALDLGISRGVEICDAASLHTEELVDAIVTSPPYMGQLDYARDNRLRLHLLGIDNLEELNREISPSAGQFVEQMDGWLAAWRKILKPNGKLAILVGDTTNTTKKRLDSLVVNLITSKWRDYELVDNFESHIPDARRSRKNCKGSLSESLLVFRLRPN